MDTYGKELILDLHDCDVQTFNRESLDEFFSQLCDLLNMQKCERYFWDDEGVPEDERQTSAHTKGISAVQFILTSNITIHTLELLQCVFINVFSCKDYDADKAVDFCKRWFAGTAVKWCVVDRMKP